jgi:hypothetical protein
VDTGALGQAVLFAVILTAWIALSFLSTRRFLFLTGMLTVIVVPRLDIGVGLEWYKLVAPLSLALLVFSRRKPRGPMPAGFRVFVAYAVGATAVWMIAEYAVLRRHVGAAAMGLGPAQSTYKMPVQLGSFLAQVLALYIVPTRARSQEEASAAVRGFRAGVALSFAFGVILFLATGAGMLGQEGQGILEWRGYSIVRIGGLSGEPKQLGILAALFLIWELSRAAFGKGRAIPLTLAVVALFATLSTSAWAGALAGSAVLLIMSIKYVKVARLRAWALVGAAVVLVMLTGSLVVSLASTRFTRRVFGDSSELGRQKDMLVLQAFEDKPIHALYGFGVGGADLAVIPYIPPEELAYQRTPTPGAAGMRLLGDLGLVGLGLLIAAAWRWAGQLLRWGRHHEAAFVLGGLATILLGSSVALTAYLLLVGATLTVARLEQVRCS